MQRGEAVPADVVVVSGGVHLSVQDDLPTALTSTLGNHVGVRTVRSSLTEVPVFYGPFDAALVLMPMERSASGAAAGTTACPGLIDATQYMETKTTALRDLLRLMIDGATIGVLGCEETSAAEAEMLAGLPIGAVPASSGRGATGAPLRDIVAPAASAASNVINCSGLGALPRLSVYSIPGYFSLQSGLSLHHQAHVAVSSPEDAAQAYVMVPFHGRVVHGFKRGSRQMGVPTANVDVTDVRESNDPSLLKGMSRGVYFGFCQFLPSGSDDGDDTLYRMVMNKGRNPTFAAEAGEKDDERANTYEVHILDKDFGDFYGRRLSVVCVVRVALS